LRCCGGASGIDDASVIMASPLVCCCGLVSRGIAAELRDELLFGGIFYSLKEAQIVIEQ
jgi:hypothetical protein